MWSYYQKLKELCEIFIASVEDEIQLHVKWFTVTFYKLLLQTLQQDLPFHYIHSPAPSSCWQVYWRWKSLVHCVRKFLTTVYQNEI